MDAIEAKTILVEYGIKLDAAGMVIGPGGNISARAGDVVYIKASGASMGDGREADYVGLDIATGDAVDGDAKPSCEFNMHLAAYRARPEATAFVHAHPTYATAWGSSGKTLKALTPDFAAFLGAEVPVLPYTSPASDDLAAAVAGALAEHEAAILQCHGMVAVGSSMRDACVKTLLVDDAAKMALAAMAAGIDPKYLDPAEARKIHGWEVEVFRREMLKK